MELTGQYRLPAPRTAVWAALNDPEVLRACIPGCESLTKLSDTEMQAAVVAKIGPVKARFSGKVTLSNLDPPAGYTITGEGSGGAAGFAKGGADVKLSEDGAETVLDYDVHAQIGGKIAQLGSRLVDGVAKKLADEFFAAFAARVAADNAVGAAPSVASETAAIVAPQPTLAAGAPATSVPIVEAPDLDERPAPPEEETAVGTTGPTSVPLAAEAAPPEPEKPSWTRNAGFILGAVVIVVVILVLLSRL
jgi:carbon monoxide dehydrogenase subunit G